MITIIMSIKFHSILEIIPSIKFHNIFEICNKNIDNKISVQHNFTMSLPFYNRNLKKIPKVADSISSSLSFGSSFKTPQNPKGKNIFQNWKLAESNHCNHEILEYSENQNKNIKFQDSKISPWMKPYPGFWCFPIKTLKKFL